MLIKACLKVFYPSDDDCSNPGDRRIN